MRKATNAEATPEEIAAVGEVVVEYERRLAELTAEGETRTSASRRRRTAFRHRLDALHAERRAINDLRRREVIADEIHRPLRHLLDHEERKLRELASKSQG